MARIRHLAVLRPWFRCANSGALRPTLRKDHPTARRNSASAIPMATRSTSHSMEGRTESPQSPAPPTQLGEKTVLCNPISKVDEA